MGKGIIIIVNGILLWAILEISSSESVIEKTLTPYFEYLPYLILFFCFLLSSSILEICMTTIKISVEQEWISAMYPVDGHPKLITKFKLSNLFTQILAPIFVVPLFFIPLYWSVFCIILIVFLFILCEFIILKFVIHFRNELREHNNDDSHFTSRDLFPSPSYVFLIFFNFFPRAKANKILFLIFISNSLMSFWYLAGDMTIFVSFLTADSFSPPWVAFYRFIIASITLVLPFYFLFFFFQIANLCNFTYLKKISKIIFIFYFFLFKFFYFIF